MAALASTTARLAANLANAQKSTGPQTPEGKAASAKNAFQHGLASANLFIPENLKPLYQEITADLNEAIQPEGTLEDDAFSQLRNARFQMERVLILQAELGEQSAARGLDPLKDPDVQKQWDRLERYHQKAHSTFRSCMRELRKLQTDRALAKQLFRKEPPAPSVTDYRPVFKFGRERMKLGRFDAAYVLNAFRNTARQ